MNDKLWQIIGGVAAIVAILVSLLTFYLGQRTSEKALSALVVSTSMLLNTDITKTAKDLRLIYGGKEVPNIAISQVRITNSGRQPIRSEDIELPISVGFYSTEIISSKVISSTPPGLPITTEINGSSVNILRTLLNPGDEFTVEVVAVPQNLGKSIVTGVSGRIAGIKTIAFTDTFQKETRTEPWWRTMLASALSSVFAFGFVYIFRFISERVQRWWHNKRVNLTAGKR